ncbi:MAG TPA: DinB family protein [Vicinamibacterales bacterium]|nr:DinB family protein [Vicinamibacterales bacterium]
MAPQTPYSADLGDRDPIQAIGQTLGLFRGVAKWSDVDFQRSYAPGKWSAREVLIHLAQMEIAFGTRVRLALTTPGYIAQSFDQDRWMARESQLGARQALDALLGAGAMNLALFSSLSTDDRATTFTHPDYGAISIDWLIHQTAGHQIHHRHQLESIGR